MEHEG
jgi:serine/threonine protein kinase